MKALLKTKDGIALLDQPVPKPGPGEVLVRVSVAGMCRTDLYVADGELETEVPRVLGHECSGVIYRVGPEVEQDMLGQRVAVFPWLSCRTCEFCRGEEEKLGHLCPDRKFLGWQVDGAFAEFMVVPSHRCVPLADEISFQAGAYLEPLIAALGVLRAPLSQAGTVAVLGENRIARLTSILLTHYAKCDHDRLAPAEGRDNSYELVIEASVDPQSVPQAFRLIRPDGLLVLKSRPPGPVPWPVRLQVEKEITTMALGYGSLKLALLLLRSRGSLFEELWAEPVPMESWQQVFEAERNGSGEKKLFFSPQLKP